MHRPFERLAGLIKFLVRVQHDVEFRQDVALHRDRLFLRILAEQRPDFVRAFVDFAGKLEIGGTDAEFIRFDRFFENFVPFGILDFERHLGVSGGEQIGFFQREAAEMNDLSGLIKRLVGGEQNADGVLDDDGLLNNLFRVVERDAHGQFTVAQHARRKCKLRVQRAGCVGRALKERRIRKRQRDVRAGNRLIRDWIVDNDADGGLAVGVELALHQQMRLNLPRRVKQAAFAFQCDLSAFLDGVMHDIRG